MFTCISEFVFGVQHQLPNGSIVSYFFFLVALKNKGGIR